MSDTDKSKMGPEGSKDGARDQDKTGQDSSTSAGAGAQAAAGTGAASGPGSGAGAGLGGEGGALADAVALEGRNRELEGQIADLTDRLLRAHAEMDNMRKRNEREKADSAKYAISKFALDIVGISDNFQRAVSAVPVGAGEQDATLTSLVDGVVMTERAFLQVLERHGVRRIDPKGEVFNPNLHQAVMEQDNPAVPAGSVLQVFQMGFMIEDRVLRPAMVVVARGGAKTTKPAEAQAQPSSNDPSNDNANGGTANGEGGT